jgi:hypothetical protein
VKSKKTGQNKIETKSETAQYTYLTEINRKVKDIAVVHESCVYWMA